MKYGFIFISMLLWSVGFSQVSFKDNSEFIFGSDPTYSRITIGVSDINGDLRDDFVTYSGNTIIVYYQEEGGSFFKNESTVEIGFNKWSVDIGDIDKDGKQEILIYENDEILILKVDDAGELYVDQRVALDFYLPQGTNLLDVDNDGMLDIFICNDISDSNIFSPDASGIYTENPQYEFITDPISDNSGNYGSIWTDIDNDNDLDLYIVKCSVHAPVDTTDPRRINQLYINDNGSLIENKDMNLSDSDQSWSVDAADIDNDGDIDMFYTNHNGPHALMINEGDRFRRSDVLFDATIAYQNVLEDFDNNGYVDILISSGTADEIYYNYGNEVFEKRNINFLGSRMGHMSVGDFNTDGFLDLYGSSSGEGSISDRINMNLGNDNNFVYFQLQGTMSNSNAIGAKVRLFSSESTQLREVKSGISYGITKSQKLHFGIGKTTVIDSVQVIWPTGITETFSIDKINTTYMITEGSCLVEVAMDVEDVFSCPDDFISLEIKDADHVSWNFGVDSSLLLIEEAGYNFAQVERNGCRSIENQVNVIYEQAAADIINATSELEKCEDEELLLVGKYQGDYLWSTGETSNQILAKAPGLYSVQLTDLCGDVYQSMINVMNANTSITTPERVIIESDSLLVMQVSGSKVSWYNDDNEEPFFIGNVYEHYYTKDTTTFYVQRNEVKYTDQSTIGEDVSNGTGTSNENISSGIYFDVMKDVFLESIDINALESGQRRILINDSEGNIVFSKDIDPLIGVNTITMDVLLYEGVGYYMTTDADLNVEIFGYKSPELGISYEVDFPYSDPVGLKLDYTANGISFFPYFFNWKVKGLIYDCESEFHKVQVIKDKGTSTDDVYDALKLYPNPSTGYINIKFSKRVIELKVYNIQGQEVDFDQLEGGISIDNVSGLYFVKVVEIGGRSYMKSIILK